jgi:uncharacterized coiled-coil protein SlyX
MRKTFRQLFEQHKEKVSDKWSSYLDEWDWLFAPYRDREIRILEIGIQNGGSLEIWGKYFSNASKIIGCDINPKCEQLHFSDSRITVILGDANSDDCENKINQVMSKLDIIIDDGSHKSSDIVRSFGRYFPHLNDDGIYIVEDLHTSYWPEFEGGLNNPLSAMAFFKRLVDLINYEHWRNNRPRESTLKPFEESFDIDFINSDFCRIHSIEFMNSLCVIKKAAPDKNVLGKRTVTGLDEYITEENESKRLDNTDIIDTPVNINDDTNLDVFELMKSKKILTVRLEEREETIKVLDVQATKREKEIQALNDQVTEKEQEIQAFNVQVTEMEQEIQALNARVVQSEQEIYRMKNTRAWRMIESFWKLKAFLVPKKDTT